MYTTHFKKRSKALVFAFALATPLTITAAPINAELQYQLDELQRQITALNTEVQQANEWTSPNTLIHMSGYADTGYVKAKNEDGSFIVGRFAPIFHFQYRDIVMLESELEIEMEDNGDTAVKMEYLTIDWFINDYAALLAGKFLSPIGQFRQNLHPSWINKLPSAPPGFGHDGAAPVSETGLQVRGGLPLGTMRSNYAIYISNGPELNSVTEDGIAYEIEGIEGEAFGTDRDGEKIIGGRFAILPMASLEIGLSAATGKATVSFVENTVTPSASEIVGETPRDYKVVGADFVWFPGDLRLRGEYVKTDIGEATTGVTAGEKGIWETWYTQLAYRFPDTKIEAVVRYTDFDSPHASDDQKQTAIGVNYLFTNNFIAKLAFEANDGLTGNLSDDDRTLIQLAYGF